MFHGFKNSEYLKYEIDNKIDLEMNKVKKSTLNTYTGLMASIFASFFSDNLLLSLKNYLNIKNQIALYFAYFGIFTACVLITFIIFYFLIKKISTFINDRKIFKLDKTETKKLIEQFDNVACDSVMVAQNYRQYILNLKTEYGDNKNLRDFYLYEIIHYLNKASTITRSLFGADDSCITWQNDNQKVDFFRIKNLVNLIIDNFEFVNKYMRGQTEDVNKAVNNLRKNLIYLQRKVGISILK